MSGKNTIADENIKNKAKSTKIYVVNNLVENKNIKKAK